MKKSIVALLSVGTFASQADLVKASASATADKPNILLMLVDDLGWGDLSCQYAKDVQTPNLDKLFNAGVRMDNFYANSSVSSPSRAALMTGRFPDMVGVPGVIRTDHENSWGYFMPTAITLPTMLKKAGYRTAHVGKWHLGLESPSLPNERGFDFFHGFLGDMMDDYYTHLRHGNNYMRLNREVIEPQGHATDIFSDWASDYIKENASKREPFFLYLAYNAPHNPVQPPEEWFEKVKAREAGISEKRAKLVALIEHLDDGVGRVIKTLQETRQMDNTLIIFSSDNGGALDMGANNGPVRGTKQEMYEGGIKVVGAFYLKGVIDGGRRSSNVAMLADIFPTLCDLVSIPVPHEIDGISILPSLKGEEQNTGDRIMYWIRREGGNSVGMAQHAVRYRDYKLLHNTPFEPLQMFNLKEDPLEANPLEKRSDMYSRLNKAMRLRIQAAGSVPWEKK